MKSFDDTKIAYICGAPGHHLFFCSDREIQNRIFEYVSFIQSKGERAFLAREYPDPNRKNIIINNIEGRLFCVDGNCHMVSLMIACPDLTLGKLRYLVPDVVRFWTKGIENWKNIGHPYDVYIPYHINTDRIPSVREGFDCFNGRFDKVKIIPADIPFDSVLFSLPERGYPLFQTALSVLKTVM